MSLPVRQDLKDYLRVETTAEDDRLDLLLAQAQAAVETWLGRPIEAVEVAYTDEVTGAACAPRVLVYPVVPISSEEDVTVADADGAVVDANDYRVDRRTGLIYGLPGVTFPNAPYTITATAGLSAAGDFASRIEPAVSRAILAYASHLYHKTNPMATQESAGGGTGTSYGAGLLPEDVRALVQPFRLERVA